MSKFPLSTLPTTGFLRLSQVLERIPVCRTKWYAGVKSGQYPKGVSLGGRAVGYRAEDIVSLIARLSSQSSGEVRP